MYLLIYRENKHLFSFYINSAKKRIVIGGRDGEILFPPEMKGYELVLRKDFDFKTKRYLWVLCPASKGFMIDGRAVKDGDVFSPKDVVSVKDFSFSFSSQSNLTYSGTLPRAEANPGHTLIIENEPTEYKSIVFDFEGQSKAFTYREGREIKIGRKKADITLPYPEISTEHIVFIMKSNGLGFWNKGKNGTYANGLKVETGELQEGKYRLMAAGKHEIVVTIVKEKAAEAFYKGSLAPYFEKIENWINQPEIFKSTPIVLLTGESGVGKEVFAEFTHGMSGRKGEFVTFNAAAIPENLAESELFGTCKGGFTGAEERSGAFLQADKGSLFLDEIAEMPMNLQSKLLRVFEDWTVRRVGETTAGKKVSTMVILATNKDLSKEIENGKFRKDLFYRISTLHVNIPPLRERKQDIIPLAKHLYFSLRGKEIFFDKSAEELFENHTWPGNVRELKSVMTKFAYKNKETFDKNDFEI